jgi:hypothetical protein
MNKVTATVGKNPGTRNMAEKNTQAGNKEAAAGLVTVFEITHPGRQDAVYIGRAKRRRGRTTAATYMHGRRARAQHKIQRRTSDGDHLAREWAFAVRS